MLKNVLHIVLFICIVQTTTAQHIVPLQRYRTIAAEKFMVSDTVPHHTALKPFVINDTGKLFEKLYARNGNGKNWLMRKLRYENLVMIEKQRFRFTADPLLHFEVSKNQDYNKYFFRNTRGFYITGMLGDDVAFHSLLYENQVAFQPYVNNYIDDKQVMPFAANFKPYEVPVDLLRAKAYDFTTAEGVVSWNAADWLNLQLGQAKHFIGEGYRSLFLSDNSYSYPFIKGTLSWKKIQYTGMYASMLDFDLPNTPVSGYHKKRYSMHLLSFQLTDWLQAGVFEAVVYHPEDTTGYKGFKFNYVNPLILSRSIAYGLDGKNNAMLGINWRIDLPLTIQIYGQWVFDEFGSNASENLQSPDHQSGFQSGVKWFDAFTVQNLYLQGEYNRVRPYTYGHRQPVHNFGHARQPLAHPLGANFHEFVGILKYRRGDFEIEIRGNLARIGADSTGTSFGNDIFTPHQQLYSTEQTQQPQADFLQGNVTDFAFGRVRLSYLLNPRTNMRLYTGVTFRQKINSTADENDTFVAFGLRTFLSNHLFDF